MNISEGVGFLANKSLSYAVFPSGLEGMVKMICEYCSIEQYYLNQGELIHIDMHVYILIIYT